MYISWSAKIMTRLTFCTFSLMTHFGLTSKHVTEQLFWQLLCKVHRCAWGNLALAAGKVCFVKNKNKKPSLSHIPITLWPHCAGWVTVTRLAGTCAVSEIVAVTLLTTESWIAGQTLTAASERITAVWVHWAVWAAVTLRPWEREIKETESEEDRQRNRKTEIERVIQRQRKWSKRQTGTERIGEGQRQWDTGRQNVREKERERKWARSETNRNKENRQRGAERQTEGENISCPNYPLNKLHTYKQNFNLFFQLYEENLYKGKTGEKKDTWAKIKTVTIDISIVNMLTRLSQQSHYSLQKNENTKKKNPIYYLLEDNFERSNHYMFFFASWLCSDIQQL